MFKTEPPAAAALAPLDRRSLLKSGVLGAGLIAAPLSAQFGGAGFTHGVASGEPARDRVLLWTRFVAPAETRLEWEVSPSADFARVAASGSVLASPANDSCCKTFAPTPTSSTARCISGTTSTNTDPTTTPRSNKRLPDAR